MSDRDTSTERVPLYDRLPELYRTRDGEQRPPYPLRAFLGLVEDAFGAVHENIEALYHDLFIETSDDWIIPYIGDLLGVSHISGDAWTRRADVANTIALRRRKGTLGAIELLTFSLTQWGVHAVELRRNVAWAQHLNHQRPDAGGEPPYGFDRPDPPAVPYGGIPRVRDPALLALRGSAFDPFAYTPDVRPPTFGAVRPNLPNLAIFLWRLAAYTVPLGRPGWMEKRATGRSGDDAAWVVCLDVHPLARPVRLFNTFRFDPDARPPRLAEPDAMPGPIHPARLESRSDAGRPAEYVSLDIYDPDDATTLHIAEVGLQLHLPEDSFPAFDPDQWTFDGIDLVAHGMTLPRPVRDRELVIDPVIGRVMVGVDSEERADALLDDLLVTYTYGAVGRVGAHPVDRPAPPSVWLDQPVSPTVFVDASPATPTLEEALADAVDVGPPLVIEIQDSRVHDLDLSAVTGRTNEDGGWNLPLGRSVIIRAADEQRPVVRLARPLRLRPVAVLGADAAEQEELDVRNGRLTVRLEGLFLTRGDAMAGDEPLVARAALHALELHECTLDPGGYRRRDGTRAPILLAARLREGHGFDDDAELEAFKETPELRLRRTISGPLFIDDDDYRLFLTETILDAGAGVSADSASASFALSGAGADPATDWGPPTHVDRLTVLGRTRVERIDGRGGIWVHALETLDNQRGCLKYSYFSGRGDRLPQHHACVTGDDAHLRFSAEAFDDPAYGRVAHGSDFRIRERGPDDDAMGAFGFLLDAHKWRNLRTRYREYMPVGIRPLPVPVT